MDPRTQNRIWLNQGAKIEEELNAGHSCIQAERQSLGRYFPSALPEHFSPFIRSDGAVLGHAALLSRSSGYSADVQHCLADLFSGSACPGLCGSS